MKILFLFIALSASQIMLGQVTYTPIFIDPCTEEPVEDLIWWVSDENMHYGNEYLGMPTATLPKPGIYQLTSPVSRKPIEIHITQEGVVKDTFNLKKLDYMVYIGVPNKPATYFICDPDNLANGKVTDYFHNGNIREEGTFKDGVIIDTLKTYSRSGELLDAIPPQQ